MLLPVPLVKNILQVGDPLFLPFLQHEMVDLGGTHEVQLEVEETTARRLKWHVDDLQGWLSVSRELALGELGDLLDHYRLPIAGEMDRDLVVLDHLLWSRWSSGGTSETSVF